MSDATTERYHVKQHVLIIDRKRRVTLRTNIRQCNGRLAWTATIPGAFKPNIAVILQVVKVQWDAGGRRSPPLIYILGRSPDSDILQRRDGKGDARERSQPHIPLGSSLYRCAGGARFDLVAPTFIIPRGHET